MKNVPAFRALFFFRTKKESGERLFSTQNNKRIEILLFVPLSFSCRIHVFRIGIFLYRLFFFVSNMLFCIAIIYCTKRLFVSLFFLCRLSLSHEKAAFFSKAVKYAGRRKVTTPVENRGLIIVSVNRENWDESARRKLRYYGSLEPEIAAELGRDIGQSFFLSRRKFSRKTHATEHDATAYAKKLHEMAQSDFGLPFWGSIHNETAYRPLRQIGSKFWRDARKWPENERLVLFYREPRTLKSHGGRECCEILGLKSEPKT